MKATEKVEKALTFTPKYNVVPPINELAWVEGHSWAHVYARKGWDGLVENERQEIAHKLNVPELTKEDCDAGLTYALVWNEFTFAAVEEFFSRRDTRLRPVPDNLRALYDRVLEQIRALAVQHIELTPRSDTLAALVEAFKHKPVPLQEHNDVFLTVWYLKQMVEEQFPLLTATIRTDNFPYIERAYYGFLGVRLSVAIELAEQYCTARGYPHIPSLKSAQKTIKLAMKARMPWLLENNVAVRGDNGRKMKVLGLHRNWFIDHALWMGVAVKFPKGQGPRAGAGLKQLLAQTEMPESFNNEAPA